MEAANTVYNPDGPSWGQRGSVEYYAVLPNERAKTLFALDSVDLPGEALRAVRPPLPQVPLLPDRFGYGHPVVGVDDCIEARRDYPARYDFSGSPAGYSGSSVPSMGAW